MFDKVAINFQKYTILKPTKVSRCGEAPKQDTMKKNSAAAQTINSHHPQRSGFCGASI